MQVDRRGLRKFGLVVGGVILLLSLLWWWRESYWAIPLGIIGITLTILGLVVPHVLRSPYRFWMSVGAVLGWFTTRVILSAIFYLIITPLGLVARLFRKKFLELNFRTQRESYWNKRETVLDKKSRIRKQF